MAGISDDLSGIKTLQEGVKNNKVTRFAYTQTAYSNNDVNGHTDYVASRDNNIPTDSISVMKVNQTVVDKGFRARASSMTRMLLNHLFGRISYNLNKLNDFFYSTLDYIISAIGQANGLVPLDSTGRIAPQYLPVDAIEYKGAWNASTNTPHLEDGTGTKGDTYFVTVAGTQDLGSGSITFYVDDRVIYNGSVWQRFSAGDVKTVSEISPDANGNVDLAQQTDMTKIFSSTFLKALLQPLTIIAWAWSQVTGTTSTSTFSTVYYANGIWVTGRGRPMYSTDGMNWMVGTGAVYANFMGVRYANNLWVASSSNEGIWYSIDGMNWTQANGTADRDFGAVCYANGIWVAPAFYGLYYSTDGMNWTLITGLLSYGFSEVYYANNLWIACSAHDNYGLWYSTDGINWSRGTGSGTTVAYRFSSVYYANGIWVAGSSSGKGLYYSTDGMNWTQISGTTSTYDFKAIYYANNLWVAGSSSHGLWYSTDGMNWTQADHTSTYTFYTVYYANNCWVAGSSSHGLWYSTDGMNWTQASGGTSYSFYTIYYANDIWVAGSENHGLWYSNWKAVSDFFAQGGTL